MTWLQKKQAGLAAWINRIKKRLDKRLAIFLRSQTSAKRRQTRFEGSVLNEPARSQGLWSNGKASRTCESNYWAQSSAPAEILWQLVTNLADLATWHPLIASTNAPRGQSAKPGLIYRVASRYFPISTQIFVERVLPGELISIRLFPFPGLQERVTYRIVSTLCGTCVLYSITLSGWLSPLAWPMIKPHVTKVAAALVEAAEQVHTGALAETQLQRETDIFGGLV